MKLGSRGARHPSQAHAANEQQRQDSNRRLSIWLPGPSSVRPAPRPRRPGCRRLPPKMPLVCSRELSFAPCRGRAANSDVHGGHVGAHGRGGGDRGAEAPAPLARPGRSSVAGCPRSQEPGIGTHVRGSSGCRRCARSWSRTTPLCGRVAPGGRRGAPATSPGCAPTFELGLGRRRQRLSIAWGLLAFFLAVVGAVWSGSSRLGRGPSLGTRHRPDPGRIVAATSRPRIAADLPPTHIAGPFPPGV